MFTVQIDPELVRELAPEGENVQVTEEACTVLIDFLTREMAVVGELLQEIGDDAKLTASDVRLILSLRGVNLCL